MRARQGWIVVFGMLFLAFGLAACGKKDTEKKKEPQEKPCPLKYDPNVEGPELKCFCDKDKMGGAVYGNEIYTVDSELCAAALHAGAVKKEGGVITVKEAPGCRLYKGARRNGVSSTGWGSRPQSFYFPGKGSGMCPVE